jgi:hypothetical protein
MATRQVGISQGVWFRLKDGRVFNAWGEEDGEDLSLYDQSSELLFQLGVCSAKRSGFSDLFLNKL